MLSRPRQPDYSPAAQKLLSQYRQLAAGMDLFAPIFLPEEPARRRRKPAVKAPQRKPKLESASSTAFQLAKAHAEVIMRRQVLSSATLPENISASERMRQMPAAPRKAPQTRSADQLPKQLLEVALQAAAAIKEGERLFRQGVAADDNYVIHGNQRADEDVPESQLQHGVTLSSEAVRDQLRTLQTVAVDDGSAAWRNRMKPREASTSSGESDSDVSASGSSDESHHRHSRNKSPALYDILGRGAARKKKKKAAGTTGEAGQALTIPAGSSETTGEEAHADEAIEADTEAEFSLDMPQTPENTSSTAAGAPGEANTQPAEQLQDLAPGAAADTESIAPPQPAADENDEANGKRSRIRWNDEPSTGDEADAPLADVARVHVSDTVLRDADKNIITIARDASGTQLKLIWDPLGQKVVKIILDDGLEIPLFNTLPSGEAQRGTRGSILQVLETPEGHSIIRSEVQQRGGPQSKGQTQHFRSVMTKQCDLVCVLREDDGQVLFGYDIYAPDAARKPTGESGATKGRAARKSSSKKLSKAGRSASSRKLLLARRKSPAGSAGKPQEGEDDEASSSAEEDGVAEAAMDARYLKRIDTFCKTIKRSSHCESVGDSGGEVEVVDLLVDADKLVPAIEGGEFQAAFMRMSNACIPMDSIAARMVSTPSPFRPDSVMSLLSQHGSDSEPKTGGLPDGGPEESEVEADAPHEESSTSELGDEDSLTQQQIPDPAVDQETAPDAAVEPTTPPSQSSETATITPGSPFEQPDSSLTAPATPKTVEQLPQPGNKPARLPPADASSLPAAHHGSAHPRPKPAKHSPPELATAKRADSRAAGPGPLSPGPLTKEHPQTIAPPWRAAGAANGFHPAAADRFFHPSEPLASPSSGIAQIGPAWRDPGIGARNFGRVHHDLGPAITHAEGHGVYGPWRPPGAGDHLPDDFVYVPAGGLVEEEPPLHEPDGQRIWRYPPPPDAFEAAPVMDWRSQIEEQEKALRKAFTADPLRVYQRYEEWLQHRAEMLHKAGQKPGLEVKSFDYAHSSLEGSPQSSPLDTSPRYGFRPNGLKRVPIARPADKPLSRATPDLKLPALVNNADGKVSAS
ncbi:hypothetical protein WJX72_001685 [[Myrmecia] bisecta]|uniref:Uncharacterized protein n=1 Tax=[Myrmecia] bisecta TaxID=41462 RepID=A0AAW1QE80_9CHLO